MNSIPPKYPRILAIAPASRGFGYAVLEGHKLLVNWGASSDEKDKNRRCFKKVKAMIAHYDPQVLVLEDTAAKGSLRSRRIRTLSKRLAELGKKRSLKVVLFSQKQVRQIFMGDDHGTKDAFAEVIAEQFRDELSILLPPKRVTWMSEHRQMCIFEAVSLVLAYYHSWRASINKGRESGMAGESLA